jgi:ankyrin repeat protein
MKKIAKRQTKHKQRNLLMHSLYFLIRSSNSEMLSWPNSPLLVLLQFVDPSVLFGNEEMSIAPLHHLADLADPFDYTTHVNQLILAKQLIEHGANVNALSSRHGTSPLHSACHGDNVTNLDLVEFLLEEGADPNAQDHQGMTPVMHIVPDAPGAAKFLLSWPTTDANITQRSGESFLDRVRLTISLVQDQFQVQQWRDIEEMLIENGAAGTGSTTPE